MTEVQYQRLFLNCDHKKIALRIKSQERACSHSWTYEAASGCHFI